MQYLVTTDINRVPFSPVAMVDGTVPGWKKGQDDLHFDHHRTGGAPVQIDEISLINPIGDAYTVVTTQLDADACVAAAYIQLYPHVSPEHQRKLRAIAYDCDHLFVPDELSDLADFAAQAVAAMKEVGFKIADELGLPKDRKLWGDDQRHEYYSKGFEQGTQWLIDAVKGFRPYPGELGEAASYWKEVKLCEGQILSENRIKFYKGAVIVDLRGIDKYVDPRAPLAALKRYPLQRQIPVTLTQSNRGGNGGYKYTLADISDGDLTKSTFAALSVAEKKRNPNFDSWGGRKTVGGSSWNNPSLLEPSEVIDIVLETNH